MSDLRVAIRKRLSWNELSDLQLTAMEIRYGWGWWINTCKRYRDLIIHFYDNHALVRITERSGQILHPVYIPYSKIWIHEVEGVHYLALAHPVAQVIYTPLKDKHFMEGGISDLYRIIEQGKIEEERNGTRDYKYNEYVF